MVSSPHFLNSSHDCSDPYCHFCFSALLIKFVRVIDRAPVDKHFYCLLFAALASTANARLRHSSDWRRKQFVIWIDWLCQLPVALGSCQAENRCLGIIYFYRISPTYTVLKLLHLAHLILITPRTLSLLLESY
jgi:hypothetical protein